MPGTITGTHTVGLNLASYGGTVTVVAGASVSGSSAALYGGAKASTPWSITNYGFLFGHYYGIDLRSSGFVTNAGTVSGGTKDGVILAAGGSVGNLNTGTISGNSDGIRLSAGGTVINAGLISGVGGDGIYLAAGGTVTNSGTINSHNAAIGFNRGFGGRLIVDAGAVFNGVVDGGNLAGSSIVSTLEFASGAAAGTITGLGTEFRDFAQTSIDAGANWDLSGTNTLVAGTTLANAGTLSVLGGTLADAGAITGAGTVEIGAGGFLNVTGSVAATQTILLDRGGLLQLGTVLTNDGLIAGRTIGVSLAAGGTLINLSGGTISGGARGVYASASTVLATNAGTISSSGSYGVLFLAGGSIDNVGNSAAISGGFVGIVVSSGTGYVTNTGTISGVAGMDFVDYGSVDNLGAGVIKGQSVGVQIGLDGTIINAGTISGGNQAVVFSPGYNNRLIVDPGAAFYGNVTGGNAIGSTTVSTLELAAGTAVGTISGLGSQFVDFAQTTIDAGANWDLSGTNTLVADTTLIDSGVLVVARGTFTNNGLIQINSSLTLGALTGTGTVVVGSDFALFGASYFLDVIGTVAASQTILFNYGGMAQIGTSITNDKRISVNSGPGISLTSGQAITNLQKGIIGGSSDGVYANAGTHVITNAGYIYGKNGDGVIFTTGAGDNVDNLYSGRISGSNYGIVLESAGTITNAGFIRGLANSIKFSAGFSDRLIVDPGAVFQGNVTGGNAIGSTIVSTLELAAGPTAGAMTGLGIQFIDFAQTTIDAGANWDLSGTNTLVAGATLTDAGTLSVQSGTFTNVGTFLVQGGAFTDTGTLTNDGLIAGRTIGVSLAAGGTLINLSGGTISGGARGVYASASTVLATNAGTISSSGSYGVLFLAGGSIDNVGNSAAISGGFVGIVVSSGTGYVTNTGTISGVAGMDFVDYGSVDNLGAGVIKGQSVGVQIGLDGTIINAGTISGGNQAVVFSPGYNNRLIVDPGAAFYGNVTGGNAIGSATVSTLELAAGATAGAIYGLGSQFVDFAQTTIDAGSQWELTGANTLVAGATIADAGTLSVQSGTFTDAGSLLLQGGSFANAGTFVVQGTGFTDTGTLANTGLIQLSASTLTAAALANSGQLAIATGAATIAAGTIAGTGSLLVQGTADLVVNAGTVLPTQSVLFGTQIGGILTIGTLGGFAGTISGFVAGDTIALAGLAFANTDTLSFNATTGVLTVLNGTSPQGTLSFAGATPSFQTASGAGGSLAIDAATNPPCIVAGTAIQTATGQVAVETLRPGDLVRTAGGALRPVRWIGHRTIDLTRHPDPRRAQPIRIRADAFADGAPSRDLLLSPDHAVFDRGRLIPARLLVNDATIRRETRRRQVTYYHVELDTHDLLLAEDLPVESFLDTGNRGIFENAPEPLILHPDFLDPAAQQRRRLATSCAPLCDAAAEIEPVWFRLADRALALGVPLPEPAFTDEPALAVLAGGARLAPIARDGARYRFALPAGVPLQLVSRAAYPSDARPWLEDQRRLGVMVRSLTLGEGDAATPIALDDPALARGWWAPENDGVSHWRWTDGAGLLPVLAAASVLEVTLAGTLPYPRPARGSRGAARKAA